MATVPLQAPGPGPTAQALPDYLSYSAAATRIQGYTLTQARIVYDPQGGFAPYETVNIFQGVSTNIDYSIVNVPQLYTGPFPAPPLGSLFTTSGQLVSATQTQAKPTDASQTPAENTPTPTAAPTASASATATAPASDTVSATDEASASAGSAASVASASSASSVASASSASAASASSVVSSSSASASSVSAFSATASSTSAGPLPTGTGVPGDANANSGGLSGGQITSITIGAIAGLLLLLLLLLCCLRRRRKQKEGAVAANPRSRLAAGFSRGGTRGRYSAVGVGAGRGSVDREEWEQDNLSRGGGSGFVVGGKRQGTERKLSLIGQRGEGSPTGGKGTYTAANVAPSARNGSSGKAAGLLGAGLLGAAFGRKGKNNADTPRIDLDQDPFSDDGEIAERRGLMSSPPGGSGPEMTETSRSWAPEAGAATLGASALAGGAYAAGKNRDSQRSDSAAGSRPTSASYSGSGVNTAGLGRGSTASPSHYSNSHSGSVGRGGGGAGGSSSNSTGGLTTSGSGISLPPPPRAPRDRNSPIQTYGNMAPSGSPIMTDPSQPRMSFGQGSDDIGELSASGEAQPRASVDTSFSGGSRLNPALLGVGRAAALGGLGALAAGHRKSGGSTYSKGYYPSGVPPDANLEKLPKQGEGSVDSHGEKSGHLQPNDPDRYSRFISTGTNLLGPGFEDAPSSEQDQTGTLGAPGAFTRTRLPTIRSVGEFGERSGSESAKNTGRSSAIQTFNTDSSKSQRGALPLPVYEEQQTMVGESPPLYTGSAIEQILSPGTETTGEFHAPTDSSRNTLGGGRNLRSIDSQGQRPDRVSSEGQFIVAVTADEDAERDDADASGTGILGGVAAGWRRLTMGQYAWIPGTRGEDSLRKQGSNDDLEEGRASMDTESTPTHNVRNFSAVNSELSDIRSERASVCGPSALGHGGTGSPANQHSSREASSGSGEKLQHSGRSAAAAATEAALGVGTVAGAEFGAQRRAGHSVGSGSVQSSSQSRRGGYAASVSNSSFSGNRTDSVSTGLDSFSQRAMQSSGSSASRSGYSSSQRGHPSEASTGAASYSPSGLTRGNTGSTQASFAPTSQANPSRRSGESASILTDAAEAGWDSSEAQSSRANSSSIEKRKRPRSNSADGLNHLSSLQEVGEGSGHYPSASLGEAVTRSAHRDRVPSSLQPGLAPPVPAVTPSLGSTSAESIPASASWRPSPRVESAAQRARQQEQGGATPPIGQTRQGGGASFT